MNFSLTELENLFNDLQEIIDYFENSKFDTRKFSLFLSNGETINYKVSKDNIAHLLGINTNALVATGRYGKQSAYEILKKMLESPYSIYTLVNGGHIKYENIFSSHILNKIKVFQSNITPNIYETEFVCKYISDRAYTNSTIAANYDYIIVKKIRNTENYACLCLVNNGMYYYPMSSTYFETKEELEEYLSKYIVNQEITVLNGVKSVGNNGEYNRIFSLKPEFIVPKLENMNQYKNKFDCILDTTGGYIYTLNETIKHMDRSYENNLLLVNLVNSINEGNFVDREEFIDSSLIELVDSWNNYICSSNSSKFEIFETYTDIQKERKELKDELEKIKLELEEMRKKSEMLEEENRVLIEENNQHNENNKAILKILKPSETK